MSAQSGIKLDFSLEKGRNKDEINALNDRIKDTHTTLSDRIKDNRNRIDTEVCTGPLRLMSDRYFCVTGKRFAVRSCLSSALESVDDLQGLLKTKLSLRVHGDSLLRPNVNQTSLSLSLIQTWPSLWAVELMYH